MKLETKVALINLASAVEELAAGVITITGMKTASKVIGAASHLKQALNKEETTNETSQH